MKIENTLAKNITAAKDKANYDAACKRLLANKVILAWVMKSCLEEYTDVAVDEIAEQYYRREPTGCTDSGESRRRGRVGR